MSNSIGAGSLKRASPVGLTVSFRKRILGVSMRTIMGFLALVMAMLPFVGVAQASPEGKRIMLLGTSSTHPISASGPRPSTNWPRRLE